jgi:hypothetical protein
MTNVLRKKVRGRPETAIFQGFVWRRQGHGIRTVHHLQARRPHRQEVYTAFGRSLDVFVNKLRKLLSDEPRITLKTVRGVGLQLIVT